MACPAPSFPPCPSTLSQLLAELAAVDPVGAEHHRPEVEDLERRLDAARAQLAADEASLAAVKADGMTAAYDEWALRSSATSGSRRGLRLLGVDEGGLREVLERALFLARQDKAAGRVRCPTCSGTGEGEAIPAGTSLYYPPCDTCHGLGTLSTAPAAGR